MKEQGGKAFKFFDIWTIDPISPNY